MAQEAVTNDVCVITFYLPKVSTLDSERALGKKGRPDYKR